MDANLGKKLVDNTISNASTSSRRPTLFADRIQLIEDNDMQVALVTLGFVLLKDLVYNL